MNAEKMKQKHETTAAAEAEEQLEQEAAAAHPWEAELKQYPLRPPEEDPRWVVRIVKVWLWIALLSGLFILILLVLGYFYD